MCVKGVCGNHTIEKQAFFAKFMEHHIKVVSEIGQTSPKTPYLFIDPFGGPGHIACSAGYDGPTSSIRVAQLMNRFDLDYRIITSDINPEYRENLQELLNHYTNNYKVLTDAELCIPYRLNNYGMVYLDPPMTLDSFKLTKEIMMRSAKTAHRLDLLIYISNRLITLFRTQPHIRFSDTLQDFMDGIKKEFWIIKRSTSGNQYTFLCGTNYEQWAVWGKQHFYSTRSKKGKVILEHLNYTLHERLFIPEDMEQQEMF